MQSKFVTAVFLGFVLIAASACGGGGSDNDLRTSLEEAEQALEEEKKAREKAEKEASDAAAAAEKAAKAAEDAQKAADEAKKQAKAEADKEAQDKIDAEKKKAEDAEEEKRQAEQKQQELQKQLTEAQKAELNARASQYLTAIADGGSERSGVTVTYERGSTLKINPVGNFEAGSGAPAISGFAPRTYTRQVGVAAEQTLYYYTNIQAPGTRAFWKIHGLEVTAAHDDTTQKPTPTATARVVTVGANRDYSDPATYDIAVSGTYDGVSGTYTCAACTIVDGDDDGSDITAVDFDADDWVALASGKRTFVDGNSWDFKPGSITSGVRQNQDTEYLYFGIWVQEPNLISGTYDYEWFRGGSVAFTAVATLSGTAKFSGGAVGKYVTRNQVGQNDKFGTFTAAANFTATFGASPTLEGRLTDFRDGSQTLTGWNVYLGGADDEPTPFASGTVDNLTGGAKASIGGVSATGNWSAVLLGTNNPGRTELAAHEDAATKYPLARFPQADLAGLVGNFHASSTDAAIAGAFGATPK